MLEEKIAHVKKLLEQRDKIEAELASIFGLANAPKRGRPRKEQGSGADGSMTGETAGMSSSKTQSTGTSLAGE
jgi:hypothetical protein